MKRLCFLILLLSSVAFGQVTVGLLPTGRIRFTDQNGVILSGGKIFTCAAGQTCPGTPLATYTDRTGTVQNTNPVILDSSGMPSSNGTPVAIYLTASSYKIVIQDINGVTKDTWDNIVGDPGNVVNLAEMVGPASGCVAGTEQLFGSSLTHGLQFCAGAAGPFIIPHIPSITTLASGSGTFTTPPGTQVLHIRMVGAGGGGAGSGTPGSGSGSNGSPSTFGSSLLSANGGGGAQGNQLGDNAGGGGTASGGFIALTGGSGQAAGQAQNTFLTGGAGGGSYFLGIPIFNGGFGAGTNGIIGSGGAGGSTANTSSAPGSGGGGGGYVEAWITSPAVSYPYVVGSPGVGGAAGTNGFAGGTGGSGFIIVEAW